MLYLFYGNFVVDMCLIIRSSVPSFYELWREEGRMHMLAKGTLLVKDVKKLDPSFYSNFIVILMELRKRL